MQDIINNAFLIFKEIREFFLNIIVFVCLYFIDQEITFEKIKNKKYNRFPEKGLCLDDLRIECADEVLKISKDCCKDAEERRKIISDKFKTILTLSSFLLAIIGFSLPKIIEMNYYSLVSILVLVVLPLIFAVIIMTDFISIKNERGNELVQEEINNFEIDLKKNQINHYKINADIINNITDYLVDLYKSGLFLFRLSLVFAIMLIILYFIKPSLFSK